MKLQRKPWNDDWKRAAMRDPEYKQYQYGGVRAARRFSWRRLKKIGSKVEYGLHGKLGRVEDRIARAMYGA